MHGLVGRTAAVVAVTALLLSAVGAEAIAPAAAAISKSRMAHCVVRYGSVHFVPSIVVEGAFTQLRETIVNCTHTSQVVTETVFGIEPQRCAVIDPVAHQVPIPRRSKVKETSEFLALSCSGTASITTRLTDSIGKTVAQRTAYFTVEPPPGR